MTKPGPTEDGGQSPSAAPRSDRAFAPLLAALAALAGALLYLNALHNPFVHDDYRLVVENPALQHLSDLRGILLRDILRPVVNLSYALDTALWGSAPFGYHLTSVLLHVVNVMLVFRVALLACEDRRRQLDQHVGATASPSIAAFATALLFAVHPMMTEAVGYIAGRTEVAYGCFFLLAFLAGRRWLLSGGRRWWIACVGLWTVALLAKETASMLPFVLMAYDHFVLDAPPAERRRRFLMLELPLMALTLGLVAGRIEVLWFVEHRYNWLDRRFSLIAADALWRYLGLFAYPHDQALFHAMTMPDGTAPLSMIAAVVGILAAPLAAWGLRRAHSLVAFGGLWFVMMLVPSSVLFSLGVGEPMAEHRGYMAAAGLFLAAGSAFAMLWERTSGRTRLRATVVAIALLFVAQLSLQTFVRNEIWSNPILLAQESVTLAPDHWIPRMLLGEAFRQAGRCEDAIPAYREVLALRPQEESAYSRLSSCLIEDHQLDEAETLMLQLRSFDPESHDAAVTLGVLALLANDPERARAYFTEAIDHHPALTDAHELLAFVDGKLAAEEHRQVCDELHGMADTFDVTACMARRADDAVH